MSNFVERFKKKQPLVLGVSLILLGSLGSTLAATITLNRGGPVQFAQGVYEIDACQRTGKLSTYGDNQVLEVRGFNALQ